MKRKKNQENQRNNERSEKMKENISKMANGVMSEEIMKA